MDLKQQFLEYKSEFDRKIIDFLDRKIQEAERINPTAGKNLEEFQKLVVVGGKRVRPALVHFTSIAGGREPDDTTTYVGMALEIFHTFALIHDDIIDESLVRRGYPTMEASYQKIFKDNGFNDERSRHFALSSAILGGDYGLVIANQIMSELDIDLERKDLIQRLYATMQFELCAGQIDDCFGVGLADWDSITQDRIDKMMKTKSGNYSIQKPMLLGGLLAGVSKDQYEALAVAGEKIGLVYQITDDIIGVFGKEAETGKSTDSDILEGKRNLLMYKTYIQCNDSEKQHFRSIVGNTRASDHDIETIRDLIQNKGVQDELQGYCNRLVEESKELIYSVFDQNNTGTQFITNLSEYLLIRKS
jgi:geranylgeranyl diphosphate synthase type I